MTLEERFSRQISENEKHSNEKLYAFIETKIEKDKGFLLIDLTKEDFGLYSIDVENDHPKCVLPNLKLKK